MHSNTGLTPDDDEIPWWIRWVLGLVVLGALVTVCVAVPEAIPIASVVATVLVLIWPWMRGPRP